MKKHLRLQVLFHDVCPGGQMMLPAPMMRATRRVAHDVCLRHMQGKHRIIVSAANNIISERKLRNIISRGNGGIIDFKRVLI